MNHPTSVKTKKRSNLICLSCINGKESETVFKQSPLGEEKSNSENETKNIIIIVIFCLKSKLIDTLIISSKFSSRTKDKFISSESSKTQIPDGFHFRCLRLYSCTDSYSTPDLFCHLACKSLFALFVRNNSWCLLRSSLSMN